MSGTASTGRITMRAPLVCLTMIVIAACGEEAWKPPILPNVTPTPTPRVWTNLGMYTVTMTAAPSCSLPDYTVTRTYDGRLLGSDQDLVVLFDPYDARFVAGRGSSGFGRPSGFTGTRDGEAVRFTLHDDESTDYSFVYLAAEGRELAYSGTASGTMSGSGIVATFTGTFELRSGQDHTVSAECHATDHRVELVRR